MIKINKDEYINYDTKITWGNFNAKVAGKEINGLAPFVRYNIENNIYIGIEFIFSKEMFESVELNKVINLNNYISDITYEDKNGWISIIINKYNCNITRVSYDTFKLDFSVETDEFDINNIEIETNIKLL